MSLIDQVAARAKITCTKVKRICYTRQVPINLPQAGKMEKLGTLLRTGSSTVLLPRLVIGKAMDQLNYFHF